MTDYGKTQCTGLVTGDSVIISPLQVKIEVPIVKCEGSLYIVSNFVAFLRAGSRLLARTKFYLDSFLCGWGKGFGEWRKEEQMLFWKAKREIQRMIKKNRARTRENKL